MTFSVVSNRPLSFSCNLTRPVNRQDGFQSVKKPSNRTLTYHLYAYESGLLVFKVPLTPY